MVQRINLFSCNDKKFSWWWLGVKIGAVAALLIWWWLENKNQQAQQEFADNGPADDDLTAIPLPMDESPPAEVTGPEPALAQSAAPDDLTKIEGIGPKINATLQAAGLRTFTQLAASKPAALKQILLDAGIRLGYPDTWPEQAALAAKEEWAALETLQNTLQGGRRV